MKIERVDENTVTCFVSLEELEEHDLSISDLLKRSDRAKELVHEIMEQATEEVGYKPPRFVFEMQIMAVPGQGVLLTFSEKDHLAGMPPEQAAAIRNVMDMITKGIQMAGRQYAEQNGEKPSEKQADEPDLLADEPNEAADRKTAKDDKRKEPEGLKQAAGAAAVFAFDGIGDVFALAKALPDDLSIHSDLYVLDGTYYLSVYAEDGDMTQPGRVALNALDYGTMAGVTEGEIAYIRERGECLAADRALNLLKG